MSGGTAVPARPCQRHPVVPSGALQILRNGINANIGKDGAIIVVVNSFSNSFECPKPPTNARLSRADIALGTCQRQRLALVFQARGGKAIPRRGEATHAAIHSAGGASLFLNPDEGVTKDLSQGLLGGCFCERSKPGDGGGLPWRSLRPFQRRLLPLSGQRLLLRPVDAHGHEERSFRGRQPIGFPFLAR